MSGMDTDSNSTGSCGVIVTGEGALAALIQPTLASECEWMGWNDDASV